MDKKFTLNYLKIYISQGLSIVLNLIALFIVVPYLSKDIEVYGIYSLIVSIYIYFAYCEIGFVSSGIKYGSEYYAQRLLKKEILITGFSLFILSFFVLILGFLLFVISFYPEMLITKLKVENVPIAHNLLLILSFSAPIVILQKFVQIVYVIRVSTYINQYISIFFNIIKIGSVFIFFSNGVYDIVGYFTFFQLMNLLAAVVSIIIFKRKYPRYNLLFLLKSFRFNRIIFNQTYRLAFVQFFATLSFLLFYEFDAIFISKTFGVKEIALYGLGLTVLNFFRSILGSFYTPFLARFNHFIGVKDNEGLRTFYLALVVVLLPLSVFPIISISFLMENFVFSWVGDKYVGAIGVAQILLYCNILAVISYPTADLIVSMEKNKLIVLFSFLNPFLYWGVVYFLLHNYGFQSLAIAKTVVFIISGLFYTVFFIRFMRFSLVDFFVKILWPVCIPLGVLFLYLEYIKQFLPVSKSIVNLLLVLGAITIGCVLPTLIYTFTSKIVRTYAQLMFSKVRTFLIK